MIEVYYAAPSIYGRKVLAVLEEKGLDYTIKKMSFSSADNQKEEYLKLNPNGEIPTIVDDGSVIYESTAIIEYLNDEYVEPPLMPEDSFGRACVRMVEDFCDLHLYRAIIKSVVKKFFKNETLEEADKALIAADMKRIEKYLGAQTFITGKELTLADCAVMPAIARLEGLGFADLAATSPALKQYAARLKARPGYKGASLLQLETAASNA